MGHMSEYWTKEKVARTAWWPRWKQDLSEYINNFQICQKVNRKHGKKYGLLQHIEEPKHPWETINMDWVMQLVPGAYHPQTDGLAEGMSQTMEDILRRFCANDLEYKDHEGYTHDWVTLLPAVQLAYNTSQHSPTGKTPALVEKQFNPLFPVDHLKKNLLTIHPTAKDFHEMQKRACDPAAKLIAEAKEYNKQRRYKSHMDPDFKEGDQGENAVEVKLTEEFTRKHPVFPVSLVKPYFHTEEDKFPFRKRNPTPPGNVEVEDSPGSVKKIIKARKIRLSGKDQRQYLV
ncbi:hypothetical protein O181_009560 [Austropuccinia psidii MF-1]|uniref:Integrase zinc-binding domain-containing protein n=1 Tax=Austropuccinia psidii MF-1 TaxID=1389203 RepID=A0A9Q3BS71_9BASI|nr:hypothetical protein [Austropuccinia psidii MF-1]